MANRYLKVIAIIFASLTALISMPIVTAKTITTKRARLLPIIKDPKDYTWDGLDVKEVYITHDADYLYVRIDFYGQFSANSGAYNIYLDIDRDSGTGSPVGDIGADVQFGVYGGSSHGYFPSTGSSFIVDFASTTSYLEMRTSLSDLGSPSSFDVVVTCYPCDGGTPMDRYVIGSNLQTINVDGDDGDWTGSSFFTDASGDGVSEDFDLNECWIGDDGVNLYFRMDVYGAIHPKTQGDIWLYSDTSFVRVPFANYERDILIEGWLPLTDLGSPPPDEVWPMFYMVGWMFENVPDSGHIIYDPAVSVRCVGFVNYSSVLLIRYLGFSAASIICVVVAMIFITRISARKGEGSHSCGRWSRGIRCTKAKSNREDTWNEAEK